MFQFFPSAVEFIAYLESNRCRAVPQQSPDEYPCLGVSYWSESDHAVVWSFLYLTDLAFAKMLVAYLQSAECADCDSTSALSARAVDHQFQYGANGSAVGLRCVIPVRTCTCGCEVVDHAGESILDATVEAHRATLVPL